MVVLRPQVQLPGYRRHEKREEFRENTLSVRSINSGQVPPRCSPDGRFELNPVSTLSYLHFRFRFSGIVAANFNSGSAAVSLPHTLLRSSFGNSGVLSSAVMSLKTLGSYNTLIVGLVC
jgi:hypothetical protein